MENLLSIRVSYASEKTELSNSNDLNKGILFTGINDVNWAHVYIIYERTDANVSI